MFDKPTGKEKGRRLLTAAVLGVMSNPQNQHSLDDVYTFVRAYIAEHGYAPSLRDISTHCYISVSTANRYLDRLVAQGRITREYGQPRSLCLIDEDQK